MNSEILNNIKGFIFDYGGTIDSRGNHWANIIKLGYDKSGIKIDEDIFRAAYVYAERALAKTPYIKPEYNFKALMQIKIAIELSYLIAEDVMPDYDFVDSAISYNLTEIKSLNEEIGINLPDKLIYIQDKISSFCYEYALSSVNDAIPVLNAIKEMYPMVLVSNFYGNINRVLEDFKLTSYFDSIIESAVVGVRKPDPEIFALGVKALNLKPSEVIVVGDSYSKDIVPSESIGCKTIWIKGSSWDDKDDNISHQNIIKDLKEISMIL